MQIFRRGNAPQGFRGAAIAVGNFDGIHRGHDVVLSKASDLAKALGAPFGVLTFEPHPRTFFRRAEAPFRLTPFHPKARLLRGRGVDVLFLRRFDTPLAALTAEAFIKEILLGDLGARAVVVGDDFRFGRDRRGDVATLMAISRDSSLAVEVVPPVQDNDGETFSSSKIRGHLRTGRPDLAAELLGRWWEVEGHVRQGDRRGRAIGFPTANLRLGNYLEPARGVYAVRVADARANPAVWRDGVANVGVRPTVDGSQCLLEVHLFDFDDDLYGHGLRVAFVAHLRPERKFDGLPALKAQIAEDARQARSLLKAAPAPA